MATMTMTAPAETTNIKFSHAGYPPIEDFLTIDGLLKSHAAQQDQKPLICYPAHGVDDFEEHTGADLNRYTDAAVQYYLEHGLPLADATLEKAPVIAMLAPSSFEVILTFFALNRMGYACLFFSTRLTAPAYARLMGMCDCNAVIHIPNFDQMIPEISSDRPGCTGIPILRREDWHDRRDLPTPPPNTDEERNRQSKKIAWILHSSGSTGFPKPIFLTNMQCLANFRKSFGLKAFCASPLFHSGGLMELGRAFYTRATWYSANHAFPVTTQNLVAAVKVARPQYIIAVPYVLKLLAEKEEGVRMLSETELVLFNGSSCPDDLGDRLVAAGVNLVANYGATETGQLMTSFRPFPTDKEWNYLRLWPPVADHTLMDEIVPGVFEAVGLDGLPSKGPSNSVPPYSDKNPANSFRTADLFTRHPDPKKGNYYKYLSRLDDRVTLVNGEKVLPIPMEGRIRQEETVREAVVFGFQQTVPGVLIFRPEDKATDLSDEEYLEAVWPAVEAANARAETFSHIMKELVVVKGAKDDYPKTDKGTFIRAQVYQQFAEDIKAAYTKLDEAEKGEAKLAFDVPELEAWLLERFRKDLGIPLKDAEGDIFAAGVDSLQTMRIWRAIKSKLDLGPDGAEKLSTNVVFEKGTVSALAAHLHALRTGEAEDFSNETETAIMQQLIDKCSKFTTHTPSPSTTTIPQPTGEVVLLTGATGNLGTHLLHALLTDPRVSEVYCPVRVPDWTPHSGSQRVLLAARSRGVEFTAEQRSRLMCIPSDLSHPDLGIGPYDTAALLEKVTCVIHSAWAVNFNLDVRSFEEQHIAGTHNLINFCLRSKRKTPARFYFCSSVSAASGTPKPASIPEAKIADLHHAQKTGYGRSKLVAEHITHNAASQAGMVAKVLRIGQLSGDRRNGVWNDTEAIPLMIRSALTVGALPALDERPSWLPVDVCAKACVDIACAPSTAPEEPRTAADEEPVYHVLNPQTFTFRTDLFRTLRRLEQVGRFAPFDIVSPTEWLERLAKSEQDPEKNPSIKLLDFWKVKYGTALDPEAKVVDDEPSGLTFETNNTVERCKVLSGVQNPVKEGLIGKYVDQWMRKWTSPAIQSHVS